MKRICVFAGARAGNAPGLQRHATELGRCIAAAGHELVYGGGGTGLMGALADGALAAGGHVTGVIPRALVRREAAHRNLSELRVVGSMHERKAMMSELAAGFIALPGGLGTLEELFEVLTWTQLGLHRKPCGLLNVEGYFDALIAFLDHAVAQGLLDQGNRDLLLVEDRPARLLETLTQASLPSAHRWIGPAQT
ncbi:MAG TPA: TIGR00730 family Rossman fold protein [Gammaproteobacteria bacterium]|nr:TIGR00730 family Rossman fold protein [Gammaproteobacteria bacterium]